jgi:hypothetical protein
MLVVLLTASNLTNILLFAILIFAFTFKTIREQKSIIAVCFLLLIIFLAKVSPQNNQYYSETYNKLKNHKTATAKPESKLPLQSMPDSLLTKEEKKEKIALLYLDSLNKLFPEKTGSGESAALINASYTKNRPVIPEPNIHSKPFQSRNDTNETRRQLLAFMQKKVIAVQESTRAPGKIIAAQQTLSFLIKHPARMMQGNGMGNFSSKLAFRATGLGMAGSFPTRFTYIDPNFLNNHLALYLSFFADRSKLHSVTNSPNSTYLQLLGEYGILGLIAFALLYIGYFLKYTTSKGYALPLLLFMSGLFFTEYWFEQLSIVILFELLMLVNKQEALPVND